MPDRETPRCSPDEFNQWADHVRADVDGGSERITYSGESLRAIAMPIGGIGAGNLSLAGDGTLRQWQVFNQVNHTAYLPGTFFGVRVQSGARGSEPMMRLLQTDCFYDTEFEPALMRPRLVMSAR